MMMEARWTEFAWSMLSQTADYILCEFGVKTYEDFLQSVDNVVLTLQQHPLLGDEEKFLQGRPLKYRSIVVDKINKIVYTLDEENNQILITDFWNTRREPNLLIESI